MHRIDVPALIVGGGGAGLSASIFLAELGVESLLIERHPSTSNLPKAHYLNQRTMEIFRLHGAADAVYAESAPRENMAKFKWITSLGGDGPLDRVVLDESDAMGAGGAAAVYDAKGFTHPTNIPQLRLEPILRRIAEERNPGRMLFNRELVSIVQDENGVTSTVRDLNGNEDVEVRSQFLLGADGGKTVGPQIGVSRVGPTGLGDYVSIWFSADLSGYITDTNSVMRFIFPAGQADQEKYIGSLLTFGPDQWDGRSKEWVFGTMRGANDPVQLDTDSALRLIRESLKIDVPIEVHKVSSWSLETTVTDRFSVGRVYLMGDAAHKQTPGAGLGLNSAIQDAHNLCWKLALVLNGEAPRSLLDSYETERRPVITQNLDWSMFTFSNYPVLIAAMGVNLSAPPEANALAMAQLIADDSAGASRRARLAEVFRTQRIENHAHDMEMGFNYSVGAVVDDGSPPPWRDPMGADYRPTTRPGCRLPHVWLHHRGAPVSTHELIPMGGMLLLTGGRGLDWCNAAEKVAAERNVSIRAVRVSDDGDVSDPTGAWSRIRDVQDDGVVLVRPDGHVGFRAPSLVADPDGTIAAALNDILAATSIARSTPS